jgi:hypothetical protein
VPAKKAPAKKAPAKKSVAKKSAAKKAAAEQGAAKKSTPALDAAPDTVTVEELTEERPAGGETHQHAGGPHPTLTTQQGVPVADDQNSLKAG